MAPVPAVATGGSPVVQCRRAVYTTKSRPSLGPIRRQQSVHGGIFLCRTPRLIEVGKPSQLGLRRSYARQSVGGKEGVSHCLATVATFDG
ncbi:MAG: hypothetical protein HQ567_33220 [Candidatus Nealsonbacteria bacterium]|nr:hypothetical protein [Candidatus Nealsonbacteria bacterium]